MTEPPYIYIANALRLPPTWQDSLIKMLAGPLYGRRTYGRRGDAPTEFIPAETARALERHGFVVFRPQNAMLHLTERGKQYARALAIICEYEEIRMKALAMEAAE